MRCCDVLGLCRVVMCYAMKHWVCVVSRPAVLYCLCYGVFHCALLVCTVLSEFYFTGMHCSKAHLFSKASALAIKIDFFVADRK